MQFNDPTNIYLPYHDEIQSTLLAAASEWSTKISGTGTIDLQVDFNPSVPTAQTASTVSVPVAMTPGGIEIDEQGVTHEIRTGVDHQWEPRRTPPSPSAPTTSPTTSGSIPIRSVRDTADAEPVPSDKVDAYSRIPP